MKRLQFEMPEERVEELDELVERTGLKTRVQLINYALTLLEWYIREREVGKAVGSMNPDTEGFSEILFPGVSPIKNVNLESAAERESIILAVNLILQRSILESPARELFPSNSIEVGELYDILDKAATVTYADGETTQVKTPRLIEPLTRSEKQVLLDIWLGMNNKQIAKKRRISSLTVKKHISNITIKIDRNSLEDATKHLESTLAQRRQL